MTLTALLVLGATVLLLVRDKRQTVADKPVAMNHSPSQATTHESPTETSPPPLTANQLQGQQAFDANCAICHGRSAVGSNNGPPLVHRIYEPSHHGDVAFLMAARNGVQAHHWQFGNMPPIANVDDEQVMQIVDYVRALQRANGIH